MGKGKKKKDNDIKYAKVFSVFLTQGSVNVISVLQIKGKTNIQKLGLIFGAYREKQYLCRQKK